MPIPRRKPLKDKNCIECHFLRIKKGKVFCKAGVLSKEYNYDLEDPSPKDWEKAKTCHLFHLDKD